jgi:hypothetical protein
VGNCLLLGRQTELFWWYYRAGEPHDLIFCDTFLLRSNCNIK